MVSGVAAPRGRLQIADNAVGLASGVKPEVDVAPSWEFPGRWGQLPLPLPDVTGDDTDVLCAVAPGESPAIVAAYERAAHMAEQLWDALDRAGFGREVIAVVPTLAADLRPVVRVRLTSAGGRHARWLFGDETGPPSESDESGDGSWVA